MTPEQLLTSLALLIAGEPDPAFDTLRQGGHDPRYPVTVAACPETTSPLDIEGHTMICGTVSVPEHYGVPDGRRVPLRFVLGRARAGQPFPDPLLYLHGGPASGTLGSIEMVSEQLISGHRAHRDFVTFDQRAAALSSTTVRCHDVIAENIIGLARDSQGLPPPEGEDEVDVDTVLAPCIEELYASDADISQYNTENNARDVRALMSALGYPEYNIIGISYGTRLALEVLRTVPEGVRAVIIDGVAPTTVKLYDALLPPHGDAMDALFAQCLGQDACHAAYPDLRENFIELGRKLKASPIPASRGRPEVTAELFYGVIAARTHFSLEWTRDLTRFLPRMIVELLDGDTTTFDWFLETRTSDMPVAAAQFVGSFGAALDGDEIALAEGLYATARAMEAQTGAAATLLNRLKHDVATEAARLTVAGAFDQRATEALNALPRMRAFSAYIGYARLQAAPPSRERIAGWVEAHFVGPERWALLALIDAMSDEDVALTFQIADRDLWTYMQSLETSLGMLIYACQEDFPYNSRAGLRAVNDAFPYADMMLTAGTQKTMDEIYAACDLFEPAPREGFHLPVESEVPILVTGGTNDHQTSWKWSLLAAETLPNSQVVIYPDAGHGASLFSACGMDINIRFILDPSSELDLSCVDRLIPEFVLPDDALR